jgi:hypothetical protein
MISRTTFCSGQASVIRLAGTAPIPVTSRSRSGSASMTSNTFSPNAGAQVRIQQVFFLLSTLLIYDLIERGDIVIDFPLNPHHAKGTGRVCRRVEVAPLYVDVIIGL